MNININSSSDFQKNLKDLLDNQLLNDCKAVDKDINKDIVRCQRLVSLGVFDTMKYYFPNYYEVLKPKKDLCTKFNRFEEYRNIRKLYCNFIGCFSFSAVKGDIYDLFLVESLDYIIEHHGKTAEICKYLLHKIIDIVDTDYDTLENVLVKSLAEMNCLLKDLKLTTKGRDDIKKQFIAWLNKINSILMRSRKQQQVLTSSQKAKKFVKFYLKLYRMFQNKTYIEDFVDVSAAKQILQTLVSASFVFISERKLLVKRMVDYWPTSVSYQEQTIKCFLHICSNLSVQEQIDLKKILKNQFKMLFLDSELYERYVAYGYSSDLIRDTVWYLELSNMRKKSFENKIDELDELAEEQKG